MLLATATTTGIKLQGRCLGTAASFGALEDAGRTALCVGKAADALRFADKSASGMTLTVHVRRGT